MNYKNFEELPIWIQAREIVNMIYQVLRKNEQIIKNFGLSNQLVGSGISIMNNIAEGFDSDNNNEFIRFLVYSQRSCSEIMSMTYILSDVYSEKQTAKLIYKKCLEERKQIKGLIKYLKSAKK